MLGISAVFLRPAPSISRPVPCIFKNFRNVSSFLPRTPNQNPRILRRFVVFAGDDDGKGLSKDPEQRDDGFNTQEDLKGDQKSTFNFRWRDLLDPDPENIVAVGLTGLLTWASVQVLWQLFFIALAILVAALKYSFIAALLLFILITLL